MFDLYNQLNEFNNVKQQPQKSSFGISVSDEKLKLFDFMDKNFENNKKKYKNFYQKMNEIKKNYLNYKSFIDYQNDENNFFLNGRKNKNVNKKFIRNYNDLSNYAKINFNDEIPKYRTKKNYSNLNILELNKNENYLKREKLKNEILNTLNAPQSYYQKQNYSMSNSPKKKVIGISGVNFF